MPIYNLACPICKLDFQNSDDIFSTTCGHIFHNSCINEWMRRESTCPQCDINWPTVHKLYLYFDNSDDKTKKLKEIELKLKCTDEYNAKLLDKINEVQFQFLHLKESSVSKEKFIRLQEEYMHSAELVKELQNEMNVLSATNKSLEATIVDEKENFLCLQRKYTESCDLQEKLQNEIRESMEHVNKLQNEMSESSEHVKKLQNELSESSEHVKILKNKIKELSTVIESKSKELKLICSENVSLKASLEAAQHTSDSINSRSNKIHLLEWQLKNLSNELEKEVKINTKLVIDKIKLQISSIELWTQLM